MADFGSMSGAAAGKAHAPAEGSGAIGDAQPVRLEWDLADLYVTDAAWELRLARVMLPSL